MKRVLEAALMSVLLSVVFMNTTLADACERLESYAVSVTEQQLVTDLTSGAWITDVTGSESAMYFNEDGLVEVMKSEDPEKRYELNRWMVIADCGKIQLMISGSDDIMRIYSLSPTCDGFALVNTIGEEAVMVKRRADIRSMVVRMRDQLNGTWESTGTSSRKHDLNLTWTFAENGTFQINTGPDQYHASYEGIWDVTPDGSSIVLFFGNSSNPEDVYARHLLKIHSLDFEDMVMSGTPISNLLGTEKGNIKMFMEKDFVDN